MTRPVRDRVRFALATGVAAVLLGAVGYGAMPQVGKPAPKSSPKAPAPSGDLLQQVAAQERRIQQLEERLAVLDQARAAGDAVANKAASGLAVMTVRAPFVVVDSKNQPIMRVQEEDKSVSRGVSVFKAGDALPMAHLGVRSDGMGRVYVAKSGAPRPLATMFVSSKGGGLEAYSEDGSHRLVLVDYQGFSVVNAKDVIVGNIGVLGDRGALEINDAGGNKMVTAGSTSNGKGVVQANPAHVLQTMENPSVLIGGSGKK